MPRETKKRVRRDLLTVVIIFLIALLFVPYFIKRQAGSSARFPGPPERLVGTNVREGSPEGRGVAPATGAPMEFQQPALTSVSQILANTNPAALTTRTVQLGSVSVQRVFSPQYILVGPDANQTVVVRLKELHPGIQAGQKMNISGMIEQLGEDLSQWQLNPEYKVIVGRYPIFINAMQNEVVP